MITKIAPQNLANTLADEMQLSSGVYNAFCKTDRKLFMPAHFQKDAYKLDALPINANQWISSPLTVAKMTMALNAEKTDSILEIGTGSGYQAAILSFLARRVFSVERICELFKSAKANLKQANIINVHLKLDDGTRGWKTYAPFDRIIFSAFLPSDPHEILEQLKQGGILVAPIGNEKEQKITKYTKTATQIIKQELESCLFVPVLSGIKH